jgi:hypothetical protein
MLTQRVAGNISGEATTQSGNIFPEAMRTLRVRWRTLGTSIVGVSWSSRPTRGRGCKEGTLSAPYSKSGSLTCLPPGPGRPIGVAPGAGPQNCCTTLSCLCLRARRQKSFLPQAETLHARSLRLNTDTSWSCTLTRTTHTCTWS